MPKANVLMEKLEQQITSNGKLSKIITINKK